MQKVVLFLILLVATPFIFAQRYEFEPNYAESKIPEYQLPDPLKTLEGKQIRNSKKWEKTGRPELLEFFSNQVYGEVPGNLNISSANVLEQSGNAYNGKALRKQVELSFQRNGGKLDFIILMYLPNELHRLIKPNFSFSF